jgi:protein SCO1/2
MRKQGIDVRLLVALAALVIATGVVALIAVGGKAGTTPKSTTGQSAEFEAAGLLTPVTAAPALHLKNYLGQEVDLNSYKGKAVLVTFIYTHCPDVCPLITSNLRIAQNLMGANLSKSEVIAVSVDPRGDTPAAISAFLARHQMTGRMQYLVGTPQELGAVWKAWGVGSERDASNPAYVNHSGLIYGITASGKRLTIYASSFKPSEIAHDVPLLAAR